MHDATLQTRKSAIRTRATNVTPLVLVALSAGLYVLSFPPVSFAVCAWGALAPFLLAVCRSRPHVAAWYGVVWTLLAGYGVAWWCPGMLAAYLGLSVAASWASFLAVLLVLAAGYYAAFAAWF